EQKWLQATKRVEELELSLAQKESHYASIISDLKLKVTGLQNENKTQRNKIQNELLNYVFDDSKIEYNRSNLFEDMEYYEKRKHESFLSEIEKKIHQIRTEKLDAKEEIFSFKGAVNDKIDSIDKEIQAEKLKTSERFMGVEMNLEKFKLKMLEQLNLIQSTVKIELSELKQNLKGIEVVLTGRINEVFNSIGKEILRIDKRHINFLGQLEKELIMRDQALLKLDLTVKENYLKLERNTNELILQNTNQIKDLGLSIGKFQNVIGQESLRMNRELLLVQRSLGMYSDKVNQLALKAEQYKLDGERVKMDSEIQLQKVQGIFENHKDETDLFKRNARLFLEKLDQKAIEIELKQKALIQDQSSGKHLLERIDTKSKELDLNQREAILTQKKALEVIEQKEKEVYYGMRDLAVSEAGAGMVFKEQKMRIEAAQKEVDLQTKLLNETQQKIEALMRMKERLDKAESEKRIAKEQLMIERERHERELTKALHQRNDLETKLYNAETYMRDQEREARTFKQMYLEVKRTGSSSLEY
ncbi:MAG: hypothetical protein AAFO07_21480, partial [Bacteroidota bacterium]